MTWCLSAFRLQSSTYERFKNTLGYKSKPIKLVFTPLCESLQIQFSEDLNLIFQYIAMAYRRVAQVSTRRPQTVFLRTLIFHICYQIFHLKKKFPDQKNLLKQSFLWLKKENQYENINNLTIVSCRFMRKFFFYLSFS